MTAATPPPATAETPDARTADARLYVHQLRAFSIHTAVFAVSMIVIFAVNLVTNAAAGITGEWWAWWSVWAMIGWSIGVAIHGLVVRLSRPESLGSSWEDCQVDKLRTFSNAA